MRKIIHVDMDAFFAAVEMRDNPALKQVPMAVGGSTDRRGVLTTANYPARKFGVKSAMPTRTALQLCPHLVLVKPSMQKYRVASDHVLKIFHQFTDLVEPMSLDEAYLDVSTSTLCKNSATLIAQEIRNRIEKETGLTASAGIASNKLIAKMASELNKPNGQYTIAPHQVESFIKTVKVEKLWGIGHVTAKKLHDMGIMTCLDLQSYQRSEMIHLFGKFGDVLYDFCRGVDERELEMDYERKSLGTEETFAKDISSYEEMKTHVVRMVDELIESLEGYQDRSIKNLNVKIKYHDFKQTTIERQLPLKVENFLTLLEERWCQDPRPVRLLGVGVKFDSPRDHATNWQLPLLTEHQD